MSKDEIKEANRRIRMVLRKHGFYQKTLEERDMPEVWRGEIDGTGAIVVVEDGGTRCYLLVTTPPDAKSQKFLEDLAGAEI